MRRAGAPSGFTLVELMMVVTIIGILSAVALPVFTRYIRKSRTVEAAGILNRMWNGSVTYYESDHLDPTQHVLAKRFPGRDNEVAAEGTPGGLMCGCLPGGKCPGNDPCWNTDGVWQALNFAMPDPHTYVSNYSSNGTNAGATFDAVAFGDLDCDSTLSQFVRRGTIDTTTGDVRGGAAPYVAIINEIE